MYSVRPETGWVRVLSMEDSWISGVRRGKAFSCGGCETCNEVNYHLILLSRGSYVFPGEHYIGVVPQNVKVKFRGRSRVHDMDGASRLERRGHQLWYPDRCPIE